MNKTVPDDIRPYLEAVRLEVGREAGLPENWAAMVRGNTLAEVKEHAAVLALHRDARMWRENRHLLSGSDRVREL